MDIQFSKDFKLCLLFHYLGKIGKIRDLNIVHSFVNVVVFYPMYSTLHLRKSDSAALLHGLLYSLNIKRISLLQVIESHTLTLIYALYLSFNI